MQNAISLKWLVNIIFISSIIVASSLEVYNSLAHGIDYISILYLSAAAVSANIGRMFVIVIADIAISLHKD